MIQVKASALIEMKLRGARPSTSEIRRDLVSKICEDHAEQSYCIVGTAGAGKSTLMRQFFAKLQDQGRTCSWLSFDERDNEPANFVAYFRAAIHSLETEVSGSFPNLTESEGPQSLESAVYGIQQSIARLPPDRVLFLDDVHCLHEPAILESLNYILDSCNGALKVVLGSRTVPELQMPRRTLQGQFHLLQQEDLNFSFEEAIRFFESNPEAGLNANEIRVLHKSTEGWAAGLQFATICLKNSPHQKANLLSKISGRDAELSMYLASNAFAIQPPAVQAFLLDTAPLSSFSPELCQHVCSGEKAAAHLEQTRLSNLFLIRLDVPGEWFRYHHLFGEFLRNHLDKIHPGRSNVIRRKAARWCIQNDMPEDAIRYYLDCEDFDEAAELIAEVGLAVSRDHGDLTTILRWIDALPKSHQTMHPRMLVDHSLAMIFTRGAQEGRRLLETMHAGLAEQPPQWVLPEDQQAELLCYAGAVELISYAVEDDIEVGLSRFDKWSAKWPDAADVNLAIAQNAKSYMLMSQNSFQQAKKSNSVAQALALRADSSHVSIWADCIETMILTAEGNLDAAEVCAARVLRRSSFELGDGSQVTLMAHLLSAFVDYEKGNRAAAFKSLPAGREFADQYGPVEPLLIHFRLSAQSLRDQDKLEDGIALLRSGFEIGLANRLSRLSVTLAADLVSFLIELGRLTEAEEFCAKWGLDGQSGRSSHFEPETLLHATMRKRIAVELAIAKGDIKTAVALCDTTIVQLRRNGRFRTLIRFGILRSFALSSGGQKKRAWRELSAVISRAREQNFVASFFELKHMCVPFIEEIIAFRQADTATAPTHGMETPEDWILGRLSGEASKALEVQPANPVEPNALFERPTGRELDILRLAVKGLSNAEIATTLLISVSTVKWHMHNAFQKLDVKNRSAAVAKANELGIL